jgi:hypothetical protein
MNERIRKLEAQCWGATKYGPPWFDSKKFAELIVKECISELEKIKRSGVPTPIQGGLNLGVVSLKEHFGVLE